MIDAAVGPSESLRRVRRLTWWALVPFAPAMTAVTVWLLVARVSGAGPVTAVLVALALAVGAGAWFLLHRSLGSASAATGPVVRAVAAGCAAGLVGALALTATTDAPGIEWASLAGLVTGAWATRLRRRRLHLIVGVAVGFGLVTLPLSGQILVSVVGVGTVLVVGWGVWQTWWYYEVARRLDAGRVQAAELAVANERLRFAAELHDIQGHHLQVIALKSELAARLVETRPEAAAETMREVQRLAREALSETRSLVGGYRRVSLGTEIANATRVLAAAGIDARPRIAAATGELGDAERLLGLVVREATTNILRHAQPRWTRIELDHDGDRVRLSVRNDGAGHGDPGAGGGLPALAERLAGTGGALRWERDGDRFTVTATAPAAGAAR